VYIGSYENDRKHGHGTFFYSNGRVYIGEFEEGTLHGKGEMYQNGKITKGVWVDNVLI
jgi:hypothetical protein